MRTQQHQTVNIIIRGNMFKKLRILILGDEVLTPCFAINPRNKKLFKDFMKDCFPVVRVNNISYYNIGLLNDVEISNS